MDYMDKLVEQCCEILKKSKTEEEQRYWISAHIFQINMQCQNASELKSQHRTFLDKLKLRLQELDLLEKGNIKIILDDCMAIFA